MQRPSFTPTQSYLIDYLLKGRYARQLGALAAVLLPAAAFSIYGMYRDDGVAMGIGWAGSLLYIGWQRAASRRTSVMLAEILRKYEGALTTVADDGG